MKNIAKRAVSLPSKASRIVASPRGEDGRGGPICPLVKCYEDPPIHDTRWFIEAMKVRDAMPIDLREIEQAFAEADCLATAQEVAAAVTRMAAEITARLKGTNPIIFCVMNGALVLSGRLISQLDFPLEVSYLHATRYGHRLNGSLLDWRVRPTQDLRGRVVLVLDDILDEGHTLAAIIDYFRDQGVAAVHTAVLVHKLHQRKATPGMRADVTGLEIEDRYLFGSGMDYKGYWRNADGIYALKGH